MYINSSNATSFFLRCFWVFHPYPYPYYDLWASLISTCSRFKRQAYIETSRAQISGIPVSNKYTSIYPPEVDCQVATIKKKWKTPSTSLSNIIISPLLNSHHSFFGSIFEVLWPIGSMCGIFTYMDTWFICDQCRKIYPGTMPRPCNSE